MDALRTTNMNATQYIPRLHNRSVTDGVALYACIAVVMSAVFTTRPEELTADTWYVTYFGLKTTWELQQISIITSIFAHANTGHLLTNLLMLAVPVVVITNQHSPRTTIITGLLTGITASLIMMIVGDVTGLGGISIGASTVAYGLIAAWAQLDDTPVAGRINAKLLLTALIVFSIIRVFYGVPFIGLFRNTATITAMSHTAHIAGALAGYYIFAYTR